MPIPHSITACRARDVAKFGWNGLQRYQNTSATARKILSTRDIPVKYERFVKKQAEQIALSLQQAKEYYEASKVVSLVTRPVMLYYSTMCLALAQTLYKGTGDVSLDRARQSHRHHGLLFQNNNTGAGGLAIDAASKLIASPAIGPAGARFGTFELWHRTARDQPVVARYTETQSGGQTGGLRILAAPKDERLPLLPACGISLLELLKLSPGMGDALIQLDITPNQVRGQLKLQIDQRNNSFVLSVIVHPTLSDPLARFSEKMLIDPKNVDRWSVSEVSNGYVANFRGFVGVDTPNLILPSSVSQTPDEVIFWPDENFLNEFGILYVALYILGNYARYFPDHWIEDVNRHTDLAFLCLALIEVAERRLPLLTLGELDENIYVEDN